MHSHTPHSFHIPVMGLAYTIDSPIKVAHFGITSVVSIIEDNLVEMMRQYYYQQSREDFLPISSKSKDYRSRRITDYLNLMNRIVKANLKKIKESKFSEGSDIFKYFDMLPTGHDLRKLFYKYLASTNQLEKATLEKLLRNSITPGDIEVNIMTKVDKVQHDKKGNPIENGSDALTALKGYAESELTHSSIVFSAGMNPRLFNYLDQFDTFDAKGWGLFDKKIAIKVSDYRSALIQGKIMAKKGLWVSEFRIESGLNCGGHAFATDGLLLGPILEEFKQKKEELAQTLFEIYQPVVQALGKMTFDKPHPIKLTVQGGIGTFEEDAFLRNYYKMDSTGWGTPFLLCPEATTVDEETLQKLASASEKDVVRSKNSPLGIPFNYLKGLSAEKQKLERIERDMPGSPCTEKYLVSNTEFTDEPICTASHKYQKLKIEQLQAASLPANEFLKQLEEVLSKECICIGLSNSAAAHYDMQLVKNLNGITICPGPNIVNFSKVVSLQEMTDHIYGRSNVLTRVNRPNMFIKELELYIDYISEQLNNSERDIKADRNHTKFCNNLLDGIDYYMDLTLHYQEYFKDQKSIKSALQKVKAEVITLLGFLSESTVTKTV